MHTDLLDTVLISRQEATPQGDTARPQAGSAGSTTATTSMKGAGPGGPPAGDEDKCPVDHKTRDLWLQQAQQERAAQAGANATPTTTVQQTSNSSSSWSSWLQIPFFSRTTQSPQQAPPQTHSQLRLGEAREISSIPRSSDPASVPSPQNPSNHEQETGASKTGHWVYPSEKQFFEAMKRKGHAAAAADMKTVVPIHNAVNERAWAEILKWEAPFTTPVARGGCGGPRLHSFAGLGSATMSPKARINTLLGYSAPFDRHDWVVDRCGTKVEYVIDFYAGRNDGAAGKNKLNFYLDVRPKLNTWEGVKMRALKAVGLG